MSTKEVKDTKEKTAEVVTEQVETTNDKSSVEQPQVPDHDLEPVVHAPNGLKQALPKVGAFTGIVSASRTLVQPTMEGDIVTKQGLILLTIRCGSNKLKLTVGSEFLGNIEEFRANGVIGQYVEVEYEICVKGVTTYDITDEDGDVIERHKHTFTGNRMIGIEPMDNESYLEHKMAKEKEANLKLLQEHGASITDLGAFLSGSF